MVWNTEAASLSITRLTAHNSEIMVDMDELAFSVPTSAGGAQWAPPPRMEGHTGVKILAVIHSSLGPQRRAAPRRSTAAPPCGRLQ